MKNTINMFRTFSKQKGDYEMQDKLYKMISLIFLALLLHVSDMYAGDQLSDKLAAFEPFIGKTWKGEFKNSTPEKPIFDIAKWERALNGTAVRVLHSVNNGEYGGESIIFYDKEKGSLVYYYFTTAGFYTTGTVKFENNAMVSHEVVKGNEDGITEVKSISKITPDGKLEATSKYFKKGEWIDGHQIIYVESPDSEVIFK
jgi:hypothetical protein